MPDYVYALHDFAPEHEDEVPFKQGERIEVIERDDLYSDGWWQVCVVPAPILSPLSPIGLASALCLLGLPVCLVGDMRPGEYDPTVMIPHFALCPPSLTSNEPLILYLIYFSQFPGP